ncbi:Processing alpha glucosidase I [Phlyctochytrium bullatum]|nr:Processing alpha glucosidase I [Phlyctochytrium bullatum]
MKVPRLHCLMRLIEPEVDIMLYYYLGLDGDGSLTFDDEEDESAGSLEPKCVRGQTPSLGNFKFYFQDSYSMKIMAISEVLDDKLNNPPFVGVKSSALPVVGKTQYAGFRLGPGDLWQIKSLTGRKLEDKLAEASAVFEQKFEDAYKLRQKKYSEEEIAFAQALVSNLIGGIGYFHGHNIIDRALEERAREEIVDLIQDVAMDDDDEDDYFSTDYDLKADVPKANPQVEAYMKEVEVIIGVFNVR